MHGSRSQDDEHLALNAGFVHDLTREALVGALAIHHFLSTKIGDGRVENMGRLYEQVTIQHKALFDRLRHGIRKSARPQPNSP
jgi:hypothetical protein